MRIEYIREMKRSYMTVTGEGAGESYETGMLAKNQISGLLKMKRDPFRSGTDLRRSGNLSDGLLCGAWKKGRF